MHSDKLKSAFVAMLLLTATDMPAQKEKAISYFGQKPPGMVAELFAPGIVSTNAYEHSAPAFSPDGTRVLWAIAERGTNLVEVIYENGVWSKPARPSFADSTANTEVYPSFSADGKKLHFSSNRKMPAGFPQDGQNRIWEVELTSTGWGLPVPFDTTASRGQDYAHSISLNGNTYFSSGIREGTNWNIRVSKKINGAYTKPELLPFNINSVGYEDGAFIAPDESFLIYESDRADGTEGYLSLFISFKHKNGNWSFPVNMGPRINSGKGERFAKLSPDGKYLFFGSFRNPSPGKRGADIYWIDAKIIDELRETEEAQKLLDQTLGDQILAALNNKEFNSAAGLLEKWNKAYPASLDAKVIYSSALRLQKRYAEAEKLFVSESSGSSSNPKIITERILLKYGLDDEVGANELLKLLLQDEPERRNRFTFLADELFRMAQYSRSDDYFEKATAIRSNQTAHYNRACAYALVGDKDKAFLLLDKAIENGFNSKQQFVNDSDLESLRSDERWKHLLEKLKN